MQQAVGVCPVGDDDATIVTVCPLCAARARAFAQPQIRGVKITSVVVFGPDGTETWTVMANRNHKRLAAVQGASFEEALLEVLALLGVLR